jgi:hypothetical protein
MIARAVFAVYDLFAVGDTEIDGGHGSRALSPAS